MKFKSYYFIGIGGISMSGLAKYLVSQNCKVGGYDKMQSELTESLKKMGIKVNYDIESDALKNYDAVVYTGAIEKTNPQFLLAKKLHKKMYSRGEMLGEISKLHQFCIAVAGTHGKTTICGMLAKVLIENQFNPTVHLGGEMVEYDTNFIIGGNKFFLTEACEYKNSFKNLKPDISIISNIESDHLDFYKKTKKLHEAFRHFANNSKYVFSNLQGNPKKYISVGFSDQLYCAKNIIITEDGRYKFDFYKNNYYVGTSLCPLPFLHNVSNSLFILAVANFLGINFENANNSLENYKGTKRRFETVGEINGATIISDYAHHPTQIQNTIDGAKKITKQKLIVVFQPHTYSRTKRLLIDFINCFINADELYIYKTYGARECFDYSSSAEYLSERIKIKQNCEYFEDMQALSQQIKNVSRSGDLVLVMGAGDINKLCDILTN